MGRDQIPMLRCKIYVFYLYIDFFSKVYFAKTFGDIIGLYFTLTILLCKYHAQIKLSQFCCTIYVNIFQINVQFLWKNIISVIVNTKMGNITQQHCSDLVKRLGAKVKHLCYSKN